MADNSFERPGIHKNVKHLDESACYRGGPNTQIFCAAGTGANIVYPCNTQIYPTSMHYREQGTVSGPGEKLQTGSRGTPRQGHLSARPPDNGGSTGAPLQGHLSARLPDNGESRGAPLQGHLSASPPHNGGSRDAPLQGHLSARSPDNGGSKDAPLQGHLSASPPDNSEVMKTLTHEAGSIHGQSGFCEIQGNGKCMEGENRTMHQFETNKTENGVIEENVPLTKVLYKLIQVSKEFMLPDLRVIFGHSRDGVEDTGCTIKGSSDDIEQFKRVVVDMGKRLVKTEVTFSTEISHMLDDINVEDNINIQLEDKYPCCIAEQRRNVILLFGFDSNKISLAKQYVCRLIKSSNYLLVGDLRKKSLLVQDHFNHKFKNRIAARVSNCRLYMAGLNIAINEANAEFVEISEGRKSLCAMDTFENKEITQELKIEDPLEFEFLAKSSLIQTVTDTFKVTIHTRLVNHTFEVKGSNENVTLAMKDLRQLVEHLKTDHIEGYYAEHLSYFKFGLQDRQIQYLMTRFKVLVHRKVLFDCGTERVKKEPHPDTKSCIWTSPDKKTTSSRMFYFGQCESRSCV